ncbi:MAG: hypothetical protein Tsb0013_07190 [Phycisphaerales bacterium]
MQTVLLDRVGSTNDEAYVRAQAGARLPIVVRAHQQDAGRGRLSRAWTSPPGGVWMTVASAWTEPIPPCTALRIALAAWRAVAHELDRPDTLRIKWPNDLLLDGSKIAGVLCESKPLAPDVRCLLVGVGINADFDADQLPSGTRLPATSLRTALGRPIDADTLADRLARSIVETLNQRSPTLHQSELALLIEHLAFRDQSITLSRLDGTSVTGRLEGLAPDGRAVIRAQSGLAFVSAGEIDRAAIAAG